MEEREATSPAFELSSADFDLSALLNIVQRATSVDELGRLSQPPNERNLWKRAALVRSFDAQLFHGVLSADLSQDEPAIPFDRFIQNAGIESVPRTRDVYRVKEDYRKDYLKAWQQDEPSNHERVPSAQRAFGQKLVEHYQAAGPEASLDVLAALVIVDLAQARDLFLSLYAEADQHFDLARCHSLLKILEDRADFLDADMRGLCQQKRQYYQARSLFAADFYQTAAFYPRQQVMQELEPIMHGASAWVFHLYATGGMGKSMFLHWLMARHYVLEPQRLPVARLDCDFFHLPTVARHPWLVLLPIADQLNQQVSGGVFTAFLGESREFAPLLRRPLRGEPGATRAKLEERLRLAGTSLAANRVHLFKRALAETYLDKPVVLILDTLEELVLSQQKSLLEILRLIKEIHDASPNIRLILAGRYDLREHLPEFRAEFEAQSKVYALQPFTEHEALGYLKEKRGLHDTHPLRAILLRAQGNPFKLTLFAELVLSKELLSEREVLEYPRADFAYLIERVVLRMQEPEAQWLLRYAVIPRHLTFEFFEIVMAPHLRREMSRQRQFDQPNENLPKGAEGYKGQTIWSEGVLDSPDQLNLVSVWNQLRRYASSYGWIRFDIGDQESPHLEPEVVIPMRELLRSQEVFPLLQRDAIVYFEQKARDEPEQWVQWICEAIYHRFQLDGATATAYWWEQLLSSQAQRDPAVCKQLAAEITGLDYVDEDGHPRRHNDQHELIAPEVLIDAHQQAAEAAVALTYDQSRHDEEWAEVIKHLSRAAKLRSDINAGEAPAHFEALARTAELITRRQTDVVPALDSLLNANLSEQVRLSLELQLAEALATQRRPEALIHYHAALQVRRTLQQSNITLRYIRERLAQSYATNGRFIDAERENQGALEEARRDGDAVAANRLAHALVELFMQMAQYEQAEQALADGPERLLRSQDPARRFWAHHLHALIYLALRDPIRALRANQTVQDTVHNQQSAAAAAELHGVLLGELMSFSAALERLETARDMWREASDLLAMDRCSMKRIQLQLHAIGNMKEAASLLDAWETASPHTPSEVEVQLRLLRVTLLSRTGALEEARQYWQNLLQTDWLSRSPRWQGLALATGLALELADASHAAQFADVLQQVTPQSARLFMLEPLRDSHNVPWMHVGPLHDMRDFLLVQLSFGHHSLPHVLALTDVLSLSGETDTVETLLVAADEICRREENPFAAREIFQTRDRLSRRDQLKPVDFHNADYLRSFQKAFRDYQTLYGAALLEQAERTFEHMDDTACESLLTEAREQLQHWQVLSQWQARCEELSGKLLLRQHQAALATMHLQQARVFYQRLDNLAATGRLTTLLAQASSEDIVPESSRADPAGPRSSSNRESTESKEQSSASNDLTWTIHISPGKDRPTTEIWIDSDLPGKKTKPRRVSSRRDLSLVELLADPSRQDFMGLAVRLIGHTRRLGMALGYSLLSRGERRTICQRDSASLPDLQLEMLPGRVTQVPWELARLPEAQQEFLTDCFRFFYRTTPQTAPLREVIKWAQVSLERFLGLGTPVDGIYGPKTRDLVREFQHRFGLEIDGVLGLQTKRKIIDLLGDTQGGQTLRALVLQPRVEEGWNAYGGYAGVGLNLERLYTEASLTCIALTSYEPQNIEPLLQQQGLHVIHLVAPLRQASHLNEVYVDFSGFGGRESLRGSGRFSSTRLNDMLQKIPDHQPRPLVILDVPRPPGITEGVRQLCLRNRFAAELFHYENTGGVLATGLALPDEQEALCRRLLTGLAKGESLGEISNGLRRLRVDQAEEAQAGERLEQIIGSRGAALFALDPSLPLLARGS